MPNAMLAYFAENERLRIENKLLRQKLKRAEEEVHRLEPRGDSVIYHHEREQFDKWMDEKRRL